MLSNNMKTFIARNSCLIIQQKYFKKLRSKWWSRTLPQFHQFLLCHFRYVMHISSKSVIYCGNVANREDRWTDQCLLRKPSLSEVITLIKIDARKKYMCYMNLRTVRFNRLQYYFGVGLNVFVQSDVSQKSDSVFLRILKYPQVTPIDI